MWRKKTNSDACWDWEHKVKQIEPDLHTYRPETAEHGASNTKFMGLVPSERKNGNNFYLEYILCHFK